MNRGQWIDETSTDTGEKLVHACLFTVHSSLRPRSGRSCRRAEKSRGEWANSPRRKSRSLISGGQSVLRQGGQPKTAAEKQKAAAEQIPPQPIFCAKSSLPPYLQEHGTQPILSSYPDFAHHQLPHRLLRKNPNDRLSPCAAASSLTVAVPFGSHTRFPILL